MKAEALLFFNDIMLFQVLLEYLWKTLFRFESPVLLLSYLVDYSLQLGTDYWYKKGFNIIFRMPFSPLLPVIPLTWYILTFKLLSVFWPYNIKKLIFLVTCSEFRSEVSLEIV